MSHETTYGGRAHEHPGGSLLISDFTVNLIRGVVHCQEPGLIRTTVHIRSGHRIDLRVKLPLNHAYDFLQGQQVIATIPPRRRRSSTICFGNRSLLRGVNLGCSPLARVVTLNQTLYV